MECVFERLFGGCDAGQDVPLSARGGGEERYVSEVGVELPYTDHVV